MNLIIFDKDQTLVHTLSGEQFIQHPKDQRILAGAAEAVANFHERGFKVAIASNQGGVEAGKKSLESAIEEMRFCLNLFPEIKIGLIAPNYSGKTAIKIPKKLPGLEYSEEISGDYGSFRKPGPGMLNWIMEFYGATPSKTWFVGDREEDTAAAEAAGVEFMAADIVRDRYAKGVYS